MSRTYFEETQRFRDNSWLMVLSGVGILLPLLSIGSQLYWQLEDGKPWGDKPLSNEGLILMFLVVLISCSVAAFMMFSMTLETRIDSEGVHYRFFPRKPKWRTIEKSEIATHAVSKGFNPFVHGGLGYHWSPIRHRQSFRIRGTSVLELRLTSGRKIVLGTQRPADLELAVKKLMAPSTDLF
jgi:hypothetical protein